MRIVNDRSIRFGAFSTSKKEINDLLKSWLVLSIAFSIFKIGLNFSASFLTTFLISALTLGSAFVFHELGHKLTAQYYRCFAEFRSNDKMLIFALIMSFFGFIFFAPGAVIISGLVGKRRNGIISAAGPATNFLFGAVFFILTFFSNGVIYDIFSFGYIINTYLGLFNMIPVLMFDGKKILNWNKGVFYTMLLIGLILLFLSNIFSISAL